MKTYSVYKLTSPSNKVYIGQSCDIKRRFWFYSKIKCPRQHKLRNSLLKYGWENHKKEVLFIYLDKQDALEQEKLLIKIYKDLNISLNISNGGEGTSISGQDHYKSKKVYQFDISGNLIKIWNYVNEVHNEGYSSIVIARCCRNKTFYSQNNFWCYEEDKDHIVISENKKGKHGRKIYKLDLDFNIIEEYSSIKQASIMCHINYEFIKDSLYRMTRKNGIFYWVYKDNFDFCDKCEIIKLLKNDNINNIT